MEFLSRRGLPTTKPKKVRKGGTTRHTMGGWGGRTRQQKKKGKKIKNFKKGLGLSGVFPKGGREPNMKY